MELLWLELRDFRSYRELRLEPVGDVNVLIGGNGSGKTNVLEAAAYLASLRSFRSSPDAALVSDGATRAIVRGEVRRRAGSSVIEIEIPSSGRRRVLVNGRRPARSADLLGHLRAVVFLPDDLDIVKRGPARRREFLDGSAVQLRPGSYLDHQEYERALRQRNMLLRQSGRWVDENTLGVWDERLSQAGGRVLVRRAEVAAALRGRLGDVYRRLAGAATEVGVHYESGWGGDLGQTGADEWAEQLAAALRGARRDDLDRRTTTVGPHRDEPWFSLDGRDTRTRASQGEQRTLALSLRLAAHSAITELVGDPPLLILDDVFSELDLDRAAALAGLLPTAQTFVTTAREEEVPIHGRRFTVAGGAVR